MASRPASAVASLFDATPAPDTAAAYAACRARLRAHGVQALRDELVANALVDRRGRLATSDPAPYNHFARIAAGAVTQPEMREANEALGHASRRFVVCCNREENDEHWASDEPEWVGKASMSARHRFLTCRDLRWDRFNCLTLGMQGGHRGLRHAVAFLEEMLRVAAAWVAAPSNVRDGWRTDSLGCFFHVYPHNSVPSLHLHLVDLSAVGPSFAAHAHKNMPASEVLSVLRAELRAATMPSWGRERALLRQLADAVRRRTTARPVMVSLQECS